MADVKFKDLTIEDRGGMVIDESGEWTVGYTVAEEMTFLLHEGFKEKMISTADVEKWAAGAWDLYYELWDHCDEFGIDHLIAFANPIDALSIWYVSHRDSFKECQSRLLPQVPVWAIFAALALEAADQVMEYAAPNVDTVRAAADAGRASSYGIKYFEIESGVALHPLRLEISKKGGQAKSAKFEQVRKFAYEEAVKGKYPSRRQAVLGIKDAVLGYIREMALPPLSTQQADKTIDGWLAKAGYTPSAGKQGTPA